MGVILFGEVVSSLFYVSIESPEDLGVEGEGFLIDRLARDLKRVKTPIFFYY